MLSQHEDQLSVVRRWGIVRTIQTQSVAEHSFRVALMAPRIAVKYFGVEKGNYELLYKIERYALLHDQHEAYTGDIPTPVKRRHPNIDFNKGFESWVFEDPQDYNENVRQIVKIADCLEALLFLKSEWDLGNKSIERIYRDVAAAFKRACGVKLVFMDDLSVKVDLAISDFHGAKQQDPLNVV